MKIEILVGCIAEDCWEAECVSIVREVAFGYTAGQAVGRAVEKALDGLAARKSDGQPVPSLVEALRAAEFVLKGLRYGVDVPEGAPPCFVEEYTQMARRARSW